MIYIEMIMFVFQAKETKNVYFQENEYSRTKPQLFIRESTIVY